jgi:putative addiction module component (TIGR02574 family)
VITSRLAATRSDLERSAHVRHTSIEDFEMAPTLQELGIDTLSPDDRLELAEAIWESVDREGIEPGLKAELERRLALADADPSRGTSWDEVRDRSAMRRG